MKQYNYIYKITNLANGKIYIGKHSTDNLNDSYMGSGKILCKAKVKYGKNAFKKEIIAFTDNEDSLNFLEKFYIKKYKSQDSSIGYNITDGGEGCAGANKGRPAWNKGKATSDEIKTKISISKKGQPAWNKGGTITDEQKKKISDTLKCKLSDEARKKMSIAHKGKISPMKGKHLSNDTKAKLSAALKGRKCKKKIKYKWLTLDGEIKMMNAGNVNRWHPDWKLIEE